jgi:hypothetical protein
MNTLNKKDIQLKMLNLDPIELVPYFEEIAGQWDGDMPGRGEDRAHIALEIIDLLKELQKT